MHQVLQHCLAIQRSALLSCLHNQRLCKLFNGAQEENVNDIPPTDNTGRNVPICSNEQPECLGPLEISKYAQRDTFRRTGPYNVSKSVDFKALLNGEICWRGKRVKRHLVDGRSVPRHIKAFNGPALLQGICICLSLPWFETAPEDLLLLGKNVFLLSDKQL